MQKHKKIASQTASLFPGLIVLVICSVMIGTCLMILLYSLPTNRAHRYAVASLDLYNDGLIENWSDGASHSRLSNSTDALMIMHALYRPYDSVIDNALLNPHPKYGSTDNAVQNLTNFLNDVSPEADGEYARYWHGYLVYIIPALQFLTVGELKVVMMYVQFLLSVLVIYKLGKLNKVYMFMYAVVTLFLNPVTTVLTFQNADIYCIMMISMILLLEYNHWFKEKNRYLYFFTINGIAVAFMDYLTYPLVAYGIPLITVLLINNYQFKESIKQMIFNSVAWVWGYAGMWAGKWIITDMLTEHDIIRSALNTTLYRMTGDTQAITDVEGTYLFTLTHIFDKSVDRPVLILAILAAVIMLACICKGKFKYHNTKEYFMDIAAIAAVGIVPFVWFFVVRNHTIIHPHLEYRQLAVSIWALLVILAIPFVPAEMQGKITTLKPDK